MYNFAILVLRLDSQFFINVHLYIETIDEPGNETATCQVFQLSALVPLIYNHKIADLSTSYRLAVHTYMQYCIAEKFRGINFLVLFVDHC